MHSLSNYHSTLRYEYSASFIFCRDKSRMAGWLQECIVKEKDFYFFLSCLLSNAQPFYCRDLIMSGRLRSESWGSLVQIKIHLKIRQHLQPPNTFSYRMFTHLKIKMIHRKLILWTLQSFVLHLRHLRCCVKFVKVSDFLVKRSLLSISCQEMNINRQPRTLFCT